MSFFKVFSLAAFVMRPDLASADEIRIKLKNPKGVCPVDVLLRQKTTAPELSRIEWSGFVESVREGPKAAGKLTAESDKELLFAGKLKPEYAKCQADAKFRDGWGLHSFGFADGMVRYALFAMPGVRFGVRASDSGANLELKVAFVPEPVGDEGVCTE